MEARCLLRAFLLRLTFYCELLATADLSFGGPGGVGGGGQSGQNGEGVDRSEPSRKNDKLINANIFISIRENGSDIR